MKHILWIFLCILIIPFFFEQCINKEAKNQQREERDTIFLENLSEANEVDLSEVDSTNLSSFLNEKDSLHIPSWVLSKYGNEWCEERLCEVNGRAYYFAFLIDSKRSIIYDEKHVIFNYCHLRYGLVNESDSTRYWFSTPYNHVEVDFTHPSQLDRLKELIAKPYPELKCFSRDFNARTSFSLTYGFSLDYPTDSTEASLNIRRWLISLVSKSQTYETELEDATSMDIGYKTKNYDNWVYEGSETDIKELAKFSAKKYFAIKKKERGDSDDPFPIYFTLRLMNVIDNGRYVTYQKNADDYNGGAHGYPTESLHSFDYVNDEEITLDYLFGSVRKPIINLLLKSAQTHPLYRENHKVETLEDVRWVFSEYHGKDSGKVILPPPALGMKGVIFSYQPYEIGSFFEGQYHFTIPYTKLQPYLTEKAKWVIGIE